MQVSLTRLQIDEIAHKLRIIADEPDLLDSYDISQSDAEALAEKFRVAQAGLIEVHADFADVLIGEIEDRMQACHANWKDCGDEDEGACYRSLAQAVKKIKAALV